MMEMDLYKLWSKNATDDTDLGEELAAISNDVDAIKDRFYRDLAFGTGGLRGVIGAGTNRMNIYTIRKATQGLADYLNENQTGNTPSVAISYDSRIKSTLFAKEAASVLSANGIKVHIYSQLMPTPCASYAVRELGCDAGIMVTASHNPAKYNGYKVYGSDGCQMANEPADRVYELIQKVDIFQGVKTENFEKAVEDGSICFIDTVVEEKYYLEVLKQQCDEEVTKKAGLKVVYTPLNGTGNIPVRTVLKRMGVADVTVVPEQENPDGNFTTCPFPNPEIPEALQLGLNMCAESKPDLLLATDPDADRVGIAVPNKEGEYVLISGNEVGALLLSYICKMRTKKKTMPERPMAVKTIVSTELAVKICEEYGVEIVDVLTGFKYIGDQIKSLEDKGEVDRYIFGFEESYGYLSGTYVRDKDAVVASMLICEMASSLKLDGLSILEELENLYNKYGIFINEQESFTCEGETGMQRMNEIMTGLRNNPITKVDGIDVTARQDYIASISVDCVANKETEILLPKSDVLAYTLANGGSIILRPSGTEPKIKAYYTAVGKTSEEARKIIQGFKVDFTKILGF